MFKGSKKAKPRDSIVSTISTISENDVTEESLKVWKTLPKNIRRDSTFVSFKLKNESLKGTNPETVPEGPDDNDSLNEVDEGKNDIEKNGQVDGQVNQDSHGNNAEHKKNKYFTWTKLFLLVLCWGAFTYYLTRVDEKELEHRKIAITPGEIRSFILHDLPVNPRIKLHFEGTFLDDFFDETASNRMSFYLTVESQGISRNVSKLFHIAIANETALDSAEEIEREMTIHMDRSDYESIHQYDHPVMKINLLTQMSTSFPLSFIYDNSPFNETLGIILAAVVLIGLYVLIVLELVHRTLAAVLGSTSAIALLAALNEKPTLEKVISWIDAETLLLLFGMMILVAILAQTGVFDYLAVYAFKITKGRVWPLIICICLFTGFLSAVLDNVTTILLMAPVTIRLCETMELDPVPVLIFAVIFSNIGGTMTPVGDPPNVIIASNEHIAENGINFANFTAHMSICAILVMFQAFFMLRFTYRDPMSLRFSESKTVRDLRHQIMVWERTVNSLTFASPEDVLRKSLERKIHKLNRLLDEQLHKKPEVDKEVYKATLQELQEKYAITNKNLLIKCCIVLAFTILFFFLHSAPTIQKMSLGWTALIGAILLLVLYDREDIESILAHVEWTTLVFFAALFVLMEALTELGLIGFIGQQTQNVILSVNEESQLLVAILIILWVSAIAGAFVDNIPLTTMMVKIVIQMTESENLKLPLQPLVWSLALGACLGGNGTLIGASANVVCAGIAQQHGYRFTFNQFFKIGFPVMIGSIIVCTGYLMVCHVLFTWH